MSQSVDGHLYEEGRDGQDDVGVAQRALRPRRHHARHVVGEERALEADADPELRPPATAIMVILAV